MSYHRLERHFRTAEEAREFHAGLGPSRQPDRDVFAGDPVESLHIIYKDTGLPAWTVRWEEYR